MTGDLQNCRSLHGDRETQGPLAFMYFSNQSCENPSLTLFVAVFHSPRMETWDDKIEINKESHGTKYCTYCSISVRVATRAGRVGFMDSDSTRMDWSDPNPTLLVK